MASKQERKDPEKRKELDEREVVIAKSLAALEILAVATGRRKGVLSTKDKSGEERAKEEGIDLTPDDDLVDLRAVAEPEMCIRGMPRRHLIPM